jgi:hypothetical protein
LKLTLIDRAGIEIADLGEGNAVVRSCAGRALAAAADIAETVLGDAGSIRRIAGLEEIRAVILANLGQENVRYAREKTIVAFLSYQRIVAGAGLIDLGIVGFATLGDVGDVAGAILIDVGIIAGSGLDNTRGVAAGLGNRRAEIAAVLAYHAAAAGPATAFRRHRRLRKGRSGHTERQQRGCTENSLVH